MVKSLDSLMEGSMRTEGQKEANTELEQKKSPEEIKALEDQAAADTEELFSIDEASVADQVKSMEAYKKTKDEAKKLAQGESSLGDLPGSIKHEDPADIAFDKFSEDDEDLKLKVGGQSDVIGELPGEVAKEEPSLGELPGSTENEDIIAFSDFENEPTDEEIEEAQEEPGEERKAA